MRHTFFIFSMILALGSALDIRAGISMSGKVSQSTGKPLSYTEIELVPVYSDKQINDARLLATTGATGLFSFSDVPKGSYTLSINFDEKPTATSPYATFFYPNTGNRQEAEVFTFDAAAKLKNLIFKLPPKLAQRKITGKVFDADGKPAAAVSVILKDTEFDLSFIFDGTRGNTDKNGGFTLSGFETRRYVIVALAFDQLPSVYAPPTDPIAAGKTNLFTLDTTISAFKINLKNTGAKSNIY